jgi:hypothetical protein
MQHICDGTCGFKVDLDAAAAALAESSKLLSESMLSDSKCIESAFEKFRSVKIRLLEALVAYRDHRSRLHLSSAQQIAR